MFERKGRRKVSCRQVDAWLMAYLKDGLAPDRRRAVDEHLAGCEVCRHAVRDARTMEAGLRLEAARYNPTLSPTASARIQERVYRRMRRGLIMQRTSRVVGGAAGVVVALVLVAGALLLWQTLRPGEPAEPAGRVTISFAAYDYEMDAYSALVDEFEATQPDVAVHLVSIEEVLEPVSEPPDLSIYTERVVSAADTAHWTPTYADTQRGLLYDLTPFLDADPSFDAANYYPGMWEAFRWAGGTWGVPQGAMPILIFYDRDLFAAAGISYPEPGWTWDEFVATAAALTKHQGGKVVRHGCVTRPGFDLVTAYLAVGGAFLVDPATEPPTPLLDTPAVVQVLTSYADLARQQQVVYGSASDALALIDGGRAAMWTGFATSYRPDSSPRNVGAAPFPAAGNGGSNPRWMYGFVMSAGTAHPDAAWRWLHFLDSRRPAGELGSNMVPARRTVAIESDLWQGADDSVAAAVSYALDHPLVDPAQPVLSVRTAFWTAVDEVLQGEKDVARALADAQQAAVSAMAEERPRVEVHVAPAPTASPAGDAAGRITITFVAGSSGGNTSAYRAVAKEFERDHPEIEVDVRPEPEYESRIGLADLAAAGDCFRWGGGVAGGDADHVLSLDPFLDAAPDLVRDDYYRSFWSACESGGSVWCLPFDGALHIIRYDKALFDAAGIPYPALDWTRDEFVATAQALTTGEGAEKRYGFAAVSSEGMTLDQFIAGRAGSVWDTSATPAMPRFDDPAVVDAVRWYAGLATVHGIKPAVPLYPPWQPPASNPFELLHGNRVAMWSELLGTTGGLLDDGRNVGAVPFPRDTLPAAPGMIVNAHYISAQAAHPLACWQWLEFLSERIEPVRGIPARRSALASDAFREQVGADTADAVRAVLEIGDAAPPDAGEPAWAWAADVWLYEAYDAVLDGGDAEQALGEAQRKATAFVTCVETRHDLEGYELAQACALQVDPEYPAVP